MTEKKARATKPAPKKPAAKKKTQKKREPTVKRNSYGLTHKDWLVVMERVKDPTLSMTNAYLKIYTNYSKSSAGTKASALFKKVQVAELMKELIAGREKEAILTIDENLRLISNTARASMFDFFDVDERGMPILNLKKATPDQLAQIREIDVEEVLEEIDTDAEGNPVLGRVRKVKVKAHDVQKAREMMGRYQKLFSEAHQRVTDAQAKILRRVQSGEITAKEGGFEFACLGLPLPKVLELAIMKEEGLEDRFAKPPSTEELERRAAEMRKAREEQREQFVPQRRAEIEESKARLKDSEQWEEGDGR